MAYGNTYKLDTPCAAGARSTSFPPAVPPEEVYLKQRFFLIRSRTSVQSQLIWCPNSHLVRSIMSMLRFWKFSSKSRKIRVRKRSLNRLIVFVSFINGDPFSDRSKSKVQTTGRQEPCHPPHIPSQKLTRLDPWGHALAAARICCSFATQVRTMSFISSASSRVHSPIGACSYCY